MKGLTHRAAVTAALWYTGAAVAAGSIPNADGEKVRLERERAVIERQYASDRTHCYQQFEVNQCLVDAQRRQSVLLTELKRQERLLNAEERKRKAGAQVQKLEERSSLANQGTSASERERRASEQVERQARATSKVVGQPQAVGRNKSDARVSNVARGGVSDSRASPKVNTVESEKKLMEYNKKQQEAAERKADIEKRRRDRPSPLAAPLSPLPSNP
jgi:colicin import membrane protein